jgi:hypothetical protein
MEWVRATDTAMDDKMHCQQTEGTRSYKDHSCSASKKLFFVQPQAHTRQQLAAFSS